jgi:hypothetical protein
MIEKPIDVFCFTVDSNDDLPPLKDKSWKDYHLTAQEWKLVKLVHNCLKVTVYLSDTIGLLSCVRLLPIAITSSRTRSSQLAGGYSQC